MLVEVEQEVAEQAADQKAELIAEPMAEPIVEPQEQGNLKQYQTLKALKPSLPTIPKTKPAAQSTPQ